MSLFYQPPAYATEVDLAEYRALREEGYPAWQARIMMGWEDPPECVDADQSTASRHED